MIEKTQIATKKEDRAKIRAKKRSGLLKSHGNSFALNLNKTLKFSFEGSIEELTEELKDQERKFLDNQTFYELSRYKSLIQKILHIILDEGFKTKSIKNRRQNRSDMLIVEDINNKLNEISQYVTNKSNKAFSLLKNIEEIRGLLFDLLY